VDKGWEMNIMKTHWIKKLSCFMMLVLCLSVFTATAEAVEVWSDDFDDGNYDGWSVLAYESATSLVTIEGNFSATSGMLTVLDDDFQRARINSTTNVGTWSFDMYVPEGATGGIDVIFMSNGTRPYPLFASRMISVECWIEAGRFDFWELIGAEEGRLFHQFIPDEGLFGWHHFDVTRSIGGDLNLFHNGTHLHRETGSLVTTSAYFEFWCWNATGAAIDNIEVNDEIIVTPPPPVTTTPEPTTTPTPTTPPPEIPYLLVAVGAGAAVVVVLAVVCLRRR
jgi:hypothetical protein